MNTKRIMGTICALSLAFTSIVMPMTNAAIRFPNAKKQESLAMDSMNRYGEAEGTSYEARQLSNILNNWCYVKI